MRGARQELEGVPGDAPGFGPAPGWLAGAGAAPADGCAAAQEAAQSHPQVAAPPLLEAARGVALAGGGLSGFTTVRLKNLDLALTPKVLARVLNGHGFSGSFDLVYIPLDATKRTKNRSIAFVNFNEPSAAEAVYLRFHNQEMFGACLPGKTVEITPAYVQGFEENIALHSDASVPMHNCILCLF